MDLDTLDNMRKMAKILEDLGTFDAKRVVKLIAHSKPEVLLREDDNREIVCLIKEILGDMKKCPFDIEQAFITGKKTVFEVYNFLIEFGYTAEELKEFYQQQFTFSLTMDSIMSVYDYLKELYFSDDQIKDVLLDAVIISLEELKHRVECAEKLEGTTEDLHTIMKNGLLYQYYKDPCDGINTLLKELGRDKALMLLRNERHFLFFWVEEFYRNDMGLKWQFEEDLKLIKKYKKL